VDEMAEAVDRAVRGQDGAPPITRIGERRPLPNAPPDTILG